MPWKQPRFHSQSDGSRMQKSVDGLLNAYSLAVLLCSRRPQRVQDQCCRRDLQSGKKDGIGHGLEFRCGTEALAISNGK